MTKAEAFSTAQGAATRFGKPFVIFRLPAWPDTSFGVVALDRGLPPEAVIAAQLDPFGTVRPSAPASTDTAQGSLF